MTTMMEKAGARVPGAALWHPWAPADAEHRVFVEGEGCFLIDSDGRQVLDGCAGALNMAVGYGHRTVLEAIGRQAARLPFADLSSCVAQPPRDLADLLADLAPGDLSRTLFVNSGSEAAEAAVKIARMFHALSGEGDRKAIVSVKQAYHGTTAAALAATGSLFRRHLAGPFPDGFEHVPELTLAAVRETFAQVGVTRVAAVLVEPVLGVGGIVPLPVGLLAEIHQLCTEVGALLIADEVMTGFGRTGTLFAVEHEHVTPDLLLTGKQLAAGYLPLAAVTATHQIEEAFSRDPELGGLRHGHTTSGHPIACAAALAVQQVITDDDLVKHAATLGDRLHDLLRPLGLVVGTGGSEVRVRGQGLLAGVEYGDAAIAARVVAGCLARGVRLRAVGPVVQIAPPLNADPAHIDQIATAVLETTALVMLP